jgi:quercetin dioxygenase-like cupin family protein
MDSKYKIRARDVPAFLPGAHIGCDTRGLLTKDNAGIQNAAILRSEFKVGGYADLHAHSFEQAYYILKGKALITIEDETFEAVEGDAVYFPAGKSHGLTNIGNKPLWLVAVNAPHH